MKLFRLLIFCLLLPISVRAQSSMDEIRSDIGVTAGMCYTYHRLSETTSPAPKGYTPFYISHFGRHGSRYHTWEELYSSTAEIMLKADEAGALTDFGREVLAKVVAIEEDSRDRIGDLTQLGLAEHRGIAERMYRNYPEVFSTKKGRKCLVWAISTKVPRCVLSMSSFTGQLRAENPEIEFEMESSARYLDFMTHSPNAGKIHSLFRKQLLQYAQTLDNRPDRLMSLLFADKEYPARELGDGGIGLMSRLIQIALVTPVTQREDLALMDIFTKEELCSYWLMDNYRLYLECGPSPEYGNLVTADAIPLLNNIIESAEESLQGGRFCAHLRFGHDLNFVPLVSLMNLDSLDVQVKDPSQLYKYWSSYKISPFGTNIQIVFFRNKKRSARQDILVKILLNEKEIMLPIEAANGCYYRWDDVRKYWLERIALFKEFEG